MHTIRFSAMFELKPTGYVVNSATQGLGINGITNPEKTGTSFLKPISYYQYTHLYSLNSKLIIPACDN